MTIEQAVEQYQELMLAQYSLAQKAKETVGLLSKTALADFLPLLIQGAFDVDSSLGKQLDVIGIYLGLSRRVATVIDRFYFAFVDYGSVVSNEAGFSNYSNLSESSGSSFYLYVYFNSSYTDIPDVLYRELLKLKINLNKSNGSLGSIADALFSSFDTKVLCFENSNMTIDYIIRSDMVNVVNIANKTGLLPKPMGVRIKNILINSSNGYAFSFGTYLMNSVANGPKLSTYGYALENNSLLTYTNRIM